MTFSRILGLTVIGALLVLATLTIYNSTKAGAVDTTGTNAYSEQRRGEWAAGGNMSALDPKLDPRDRISNPAEILAHDPKLDVRDRGVPSTKRPEFQRGK